MPTKHRRRGPRDYALAGLAAVALVLGLALVVTAVKGWHDRAAADRIGITAPPAVQPTTSQRSTDGSLPGRAPPTTRPSSHPATSGPTSAGGAYGQAQATVPATGTTRIVVYSHGRQVLSAEVAPLSAHNGVLEPVPGVVGWYDAPGWPAPGGLGTNRSILVGHVIWGGRPDVFAALPMLSPGDEVDVVSAAGARQRFVVDRSPVSVDKNAISEAAYGWVWRTPTPARTISLITCDTSSGLRPDGHLRDNWVVTATAA